MRRPLPTLALLAVFLVAAGVIAELVLRWIGFTTTVAGQTADYLNPVITAPGTNRVFPMEPEFIVPQDGHAKQDCENAAAKRWLHTYGPRYRDWGITILGDDLYCKQPLCEAILAQGMSFILVCKPDSHVTLYEWIEGLEVTDGVKTVTVTRRKGKRVETDTYRFCNKVPVRDGDDALQVN